VPFLNPPFPFSISHFCCFSSFKAIHAERMRLPAVEVLLEAREEARVGPSPEITKFDGTGADKNSVGRANQNTQGTATLAGLQGNPPRQSSAHWVLLFLNLIP
jgi:hypothetical protein